MVTTTTPDIVSIGHLACQVQASVPRIQRELVRLGINPALRLNNVDHYFSDVADQLFPILHSQANRIATNRRISE